MRIKWALGQKWYQRRIYQSALFLLKTYNFLKWFSAEYWSFYRFQNGAYGNKYCPLYEQLFK